MDGFSVFDTYLWDGSVSLTDQPGYKEGRAVDEKEAAGNHFLAGRLYVAKSGWLLLSVPNALVRGVFDAMHVPAANLPTCGLMNVPNEESEVLNAHISVMTAEELERVGVKNITERGHMFRYSIGRLVEVPVRNIRGINKLWALTVVSPDLAMLRQSYGLSKYPKDQKFHITIGVRKKPNSLNDVHNVFDAATGRGVQLKKESADQHERPSDGEEKIAENSVQERPAEDAQEEKVIVVKQAEPSIYLDELRKSVFRYGRPPEYDYNKSVYDNAKSHLFKVKNRGDFRRRARINDRIADIRRNPNQTYELIMNTQMENPIDQVVSRFS
jgi:hypothetical protein